MFGARWLKFPLAWAGLILISLAGFAMPAQAVTVHPAHTGAPQINPEIYEGTPWQPRFGGNGVTNFHISFNGFDHVSSISNANIFRSESFLFNGQGGERVWSFSDQNVRVFERIREFLREGDCQDGGNPPPHVSNVPIPSAVWLFLSAIALLFGISFCRNPVKN